MECNICTCFCAGFKRLIAMLLVWLWENVSFAYAFREVIRLIEMLLVCLWENVSLCVWGNIICTCF